MNNMLLTREDVLREKFNSQNFTKIDVYFSYAEKSTLKFIFYILQLMEFAFIVDIISEEKRNSMAEILMNVLEKRTTGYKNQVIVTSNYLYVVTLYLQSMSNWDAWLLTSTIQDEKSAEVLLDKATNWLNKKLDIVSSQLQKIKLDVIYLKDADIKNTFNLLKHTIDELRYFYSKDSNLDLKSLHKSNLIVSYEFLIETNETNYLSTLEQTINCFVIEIRLLYKINASELFKKKRQELLETLKSQNDIFEHLQNKHKQDLINLKTQYEKDLKKSRKLQNKLNHKLDELLETFSKNHPELNDDELEDAFDDYLDSLDKDENPFSIDIPEEIEITQEYEKEKNQLIEEFERQEASLDKESELNIDAFSESNSLKNFIQEFALYTLAQENLISYPNSLKERQVLLMQLPIYICIKQFMKNIDIVDIVLLDDEIDYLQSVTK